MSGYHNQTRNIVFHDKTQQKQRFELTAHPNILLQHGPYFQALITKPDTLYFTRKHSIQNFELTTNCIQDFRQIRMKPTDSAGMLKNFFSFLFNNILFEVLPPLSASFITASLTFFYPKPLPSDKNQYAQQFPTKAIITISNNTRIRRHVLLMLSFLLVPS